jgi:hypothetical protein
MFNLGFKFLKLMGLITHLLWIAFVVEHTCLEEITGLFIIHSLLDEG